MISRAVIPLFSRARSGTSYLSVWSSSGNLHLKDLAPFQQRFNVALSRARDREYLYHSVSEEILKPDDLKAKVLRHFKNPMEGRIASAGDLMSLCQSGFERDVLARLLDLGYRVQPQVKVGPYSIDLVVEGAMIGGLPSSLMRPIPRAGAVGRRPGATACDGARRLAVLALLGIKFPA